MCPPQTIRIALCSNLYSVQVSVWGQKMADSEGGHVRDTTHVLHTQTAAECACLWARHPVCLNTNLSHHSGASLESTNHKAVTAVTWWLSQERMLLGAVQLRNFNCVDCSFSGARSTQTGAVNQVNFQRGSKLISGVAPVGTAAAGTPNLQRHIQEQLQLDFGLETNLCSPFFTGFRKLRNLANCRLSGNAFVVMSSNTVITWLAPIRKHL